MLCTSGRFIEGLHTNSEREGLEANTCGRVLTLLNGAKVCHHCDGLGRDPYAPAAKAQDQR